MRMDETERTGNVSNSFFTADYADGADQKRKMIIS